MIHINEFDAPKGEVVAAYTATTAPEGVVIGRSGNAVAVRLGNGHLAVVSRPRVDGDIALVVDGAFFAPDIDLSWAF